MRHPTRTVLVTGAARGIGKNIAQAFASQGDTVIVADIDPQAGMATVSDFQSNGLNAAFFHSDLSELNAPQALVNQVVGKFGAIHVLINNVRAGKKTTFSSESEQNWDLTFNTMVRATFFASREAIFHMQKNKTPSTIINIASILSHLVTKDCPSYQIAKAAIAQTTRYLALQAGKHDIRVNTISPGFIVQDEYLDKFNSPDNTDYRDMALGSVTTSQIGTSDDIAQAALFLASPQAKFINGHELTLDGGASFREQFDLLTSQNQPASPAL